MNERTVETAVCGIVKKLGGVCWKWVSPGRGGVPDRVCLFKNGRILFIELKRPGLKDGRSEQQKKVARIMDALGHPVHRVDSAEGFKELLRKEGIADEV